MADFKIVTDSTCDLPDSFLQEYDVACMNLSYILDGVTYGDDQKLTPEEFYARMRQGVMPTTSQVNPEQALTCFQQVLQEQKNILCLSFSSGLSGTYNSAGIAAQMAMEEDPESHIIVMDSLCASLGEGMFVYTAIELKKQGLSMEETAKWLQEHMDEFVHVFTVDDLFHLYRGGRVSKSTAVLGTMISIKPVMHVDMAGKLIPLKTVRGRKKSLNTLVDLMAEKTADYDSPFDQVMICHSDSLEDAEYVKQEVQKRFGRKAVLINFIGPTIGSHTGPGTVGLFFFGKTR